MLEKASDWGSLIAALRRLQSMDGMEIDPKEIMSSDFNKVFPNEEEAYMDAQVRNYKKGKPVTVENLDKFVDKMVDDFLDRI